MDWGGGGSFEVNADVDDAAHSIGVAPSPGLSIDLKCRWGGGFYKPKQTTYRY